MRMNTLIKSLLFSIVHFDCWKNLACWFECYCNKQFLSMWNMKTQCLDHFIFSTLHYVCLSLSNYVIEHYMLAAYKHECVIIHKHTVLSYWIL